MRNFLLGVAVGATGMAIYTGHLKVDVSDKIKKDVDEAKAKVEDAADEAASPQNEEEGRVG